MPLIFLASAIKSSESKGTFWMSTNMDPEYAYLLNSQNMAEYKIVGHVDHPGTTLQMLGAAVLIVDRILKGQTTVEYRHALLKDPEKYIHKIIKVITYLYVFTLFYCGLLILKTSSSLLTALAFQFSPFLFIQTMWWFSYRLCGEPLLVISALWLICVSYCYYYSLKGFTETKYTMWSGVIVGFGLVTKIVFAPLFFLPFLLLRKAKSRAKLVGWVLLTFLILVVPILDKFNNYTRFIKDIFLHKGHYGQGEKGFMSFEQAEKFINTLWVTNSLMVWIPLLAAVIFVLSFRKKMSSRLQMSSVRLMGSALVSIIILFAMVLKHPDMHYLISGIPVLGLLVMLLVQRSFVFKMAFILLAFSNLKHLNQTYKSSQNLAASISAEWAVQEILLNNKFSACSRVVYSNNSIYNALAFGNHFSTRRYKDDFNSLYPRVYTLASESALKAWDESAYEFKKIKNQNECMVLIAPKEMAASYIEILKLKLLDSGSYNNIYLIN